MASFNKSDKTFSHFYRAIKYIFDSVGSDGSWGGDDFEEWKPIITALTIELFFDLQSEVDAVWYIRKNNSLVECPLNRTLSYLNGCIRADGRFGEDLWDSVRFATIIIKYDLGPRIPDFHKLKRYVDNSIESHAYRSKSSTWDGPGTQAAIIDYLDESGNRIKADSIYSDLSSSQLQDGSFRGPVNEVGEGLTHPIWHSAQVLITSLRRKPCEKDAEIQKIVKYILDSREIESDHWRSFSRYDVYFSSYAIIALNKLTERPTNVIEKSIDWLCGQMSESGKVKDSGGTIMAALALRSMLPRTITAEIGLAELRYLDLSRTMIEDMEERIESERTAHAAVQLDLANYRKKFDMADIVLTKKQMLYMSIFALLATLLLGMAPFAISRMDSGSKDQEKIISQLLKMIQEADSKEPSLNPQTSPIKGSIDEKQSN